MKYVTNDFVKLMASPEFILHHNATSVYILSPFTSFVSECKTVNPLYKKKSYESGTKKIFFFFQILLCMQIQNICAINDRKNNWVLRQYYGN